MTAAGCASMRAQYLATAHRLEQILTGDLSWYDGKVLPADCGIATHRVEELTDLSTLGTTLDQFAKRFPNIDRQAVASYWSLSYFAFVIPPVVASHLLPGPPIEAIGLRLADDASIEVLTCRLLPAASAASSEHGLSDLVAVHLAEMVRAMSRATGLAHRLFWNNAAGYIAWTTAVVAQRLDQPLDRAQFLAGDWLSGARPNPVRGLLDAVPDNASLTFQRRVCCLRNRLPHLSQCADCPAIARLIKPDKQ